MVYKDGDILGYKDQLAEFIFKIVGISETIPDRPVFHIEVLYMIKDPFTLGPPDALGSYSIVKHSYIPENIEKLKVLYG